MTSRQFLLIVALVQGVLLAALLALIALNRWFRVRRRAALSPRRAAVEAALQRWQLGEPALPQVVRGLGAVPVPVAIDLLIAWASRVQGLRWSARPAPCSTCSTSWASAPPSSCWAWPRARTRSL